MIRSYGKHDADLTSPTTLADRLRVEDMEHIDSLLPNLLPPVGKRPPPIPKNSTSYEEAIITAPGWRVMFGDVAGTD
jgi:hypothetical protein